MSKSPQAALIIEDEPLIAQRLARMLENLLPKPCTISSVDQVEDAFTWLDSRHADWIFLDLNLKGEDGFELLRRVTSYAGQTIVVSANTDRAIEAFELGIADFVAKPFSEARLSKAINRISKTPGAREAALKYVSFRIGKTVKTFPVSEIIAIAAEDKYSSITLANGETRFHDKPIGAFELRLPDCFLRVHKSHIVNLDRVEAFESAPGSRYQLIAQNQTKVPVSRKMVSRIRAMIV